MEKQISDIKELDEDEIASLIYDRIDAYWSKFPNIWKYVTKDDMATQVALDLYRPRKADGVPHIVHYYNTRGERSLKPLVGMIAYNVLVAEARDIYSTGVFNNDMRRNIYSPLSLDEPLNTSDEKDVTLNDILPGNADIPKEVDYIMLMDSFKDKLIDNVYYKVNDKYIILSYRTLLDEVLQGYNLGQISDKLFTVNKRGKFTQYKEVRSLIEDMKSNIKEYLKEEYNYTNSEYEKGWKLL